jgi:heat shock protein 5
MEHFIKLYKKKTGKDIRNSERTLQKLRREVEKAKRALSSSHSAQVEIESFFEGNDFSETLTRAKFEELNSDLFKKTMIPVKNSLVDAGLSVADIDEIILVGGSTRIPKIQQLVKAFFNGKEPSKGINPDEAVAYGAAVQAGVLNGHGPKDVVIIDVAPLTLGIETVGGMLTSLIPRNSQIPTRKEQIFSTAADNQETVTIRVFEGERPMTKDNHFLGQFNLNGIPPAARGVPQIQVIFEVSTDGILKVSAKDMGTGKSDSINIDSNKDRLSPEEIEEMVKVAQEMEQEDQKIAKIVKAKTELESYVYGLRNQMKDEEKLGGKITAEEKEAINVAVEEAMEWLELNEQPQLEEVEEVREKVESVVNPITEKLYQNQQGHSEL